MKYFQRKGLLEVGVRKTKDGQDELQVVFPSEGETKIRAITSTDNGIVIGEDSGKLMYFKSPGITLKETQ